MLQFRRLAALLLGVWLAGSVAYDLTATQNFKSVDRFLADPGVIAAQDIHTLGRTETRVLMRHLVAEQNRFYFEQWEWTELGIGLSLLLLLVFGSRPPKLPILLTLFMLLIVLGQRAGLTPQITRLGRLLDFIPPTVESADRSAFWVLHGIYSGVELLKLALGLVIAGLLVIRRKPDPKLFARESELDDLPAVRRGN